MATAEQVISLVKAYNENNDDKFKTVALQIAAHEARLGHNSTAQELKKQADVIGKRHNTNGFINQNNSTLLYSMPDVSLSELIVSNEIYEKIKRILSEYRNRRKLYSHGLSNRRKILLEGAPGTGKTMTASVIAAELSIPLYTIQVDKLVTKFMGETSVRLRQVFEAMEEKPGVYLFDEFDAIGAERTLDNEVGEMRRILNSFLQFIEQDTSESIIIAATNNQRMLDKALFRRFDDVLHYSLPTEIEITRLICDKMDAHDQDVSVTQSIIDSAMGLSHAEIALTCDDAIKTAILNDTVITESQLIALLQERHSVYSIREA